MNRMSCLVSGVFVGLFAVCVAGFALACAKNPNLFSAAVAVVIGVMLFVMVLLAVGMMRHG